MPLTRKRIHQQVYFLGLILIAASLPLSIYMLSLSQILILANWIVEGRYREKWERFRANPALWVFLSLYALHIVGLLWSSDTAFGMKDIRVKLSLFVLPVVIATSDPLSRDQLHRILLFFTAGVMAASLASLMALAGWIPVEVQGYRDLSLFISHIRFSLMIVVAILVVFWSLFIRRNSITRAERIYYLVGLLWFPLFLVILKALSGIVIMALLGFFLLLRAVFEIRDAAIRFMVFVPVIMLPLIVIIYLGHALNRYYSFEEIHLDEIDTHTVLGNPYKNYPNLREVENGNYVWLYICDKELEQSWNEVSEIEYRGKTHNGYSIRGTLIRFLASKGYRKDAAGVQQLTNEEIEAIENGIANHIYLQRFRLYPRIYEMIWEIDRYRLGYSPNDKSVVQRFLYLEAGWNIARENLLYGVGNGDVNREFQEYYERTNSPLEPKRRRRAHNQFLTFLISFGIPGFLIASVALVAPLFLARRNRSFLAVSFFILMMLSMLNEDTLETAVGASFVACFYSLFIFGPDAPWLRYRLFRRRGTAP